MKDKIMAELKTVYAKLGLSDEVFDGVASLLEKTVTEESGIATAVRGDDVKAMLKTIQGQSDSWKNKFYDEQKKLAKYKESHPDDLDDEDDDPDDDSDDDPDEGGKGRATSKKDSSMLKELRAIKKRLDKADSEKKQATMLASVKTALKNGGCSNETVLDLVLEGSPIGEKETEEAAIARLTSEYNSTAVKLFGEGAVPHAGGGGTGGADTAEIERRKAWVAQHRGDDSEKGKK